MRLRPEIPKHSAIDVATKKELLRQKEHSRKNLRSRHQIEVATPNEDDAGRNINIRLRHKTEPNEVLAKKIEVATNLLVKDPKRRSRPVIQVAT